ncbi:MAG TPA: SDR family oxidoreductase [Burkholderiales bacterium]|nr:SDR family oxidoreductase [Burkholderiales bacterium]
MPTALITGATGFIGQAACEQLLARGWAVKGTVRSSSQNVAGLPAGVIPCSVDSLGPGTDWRAALSGIDVIVHLAARVHIMKEIAEDSLMEFRQVNTHATERLARMAVQTGVRRLVFLSTIKVNGENTGNRAFTEEDMPNPQDDYALSKWEAEQALKRVASDTGLDVVILRAPMVYGPGVKGNFLRLLQAVQRGMPLPLASIHNRRSIIFLDNLVEAIIICMTHPQAKSKTYLVCDDEHMSTRELISRIARALGKSAKLWPFPAELLRFAAMLAGKSSEADKLLGSLLVDSSKIRSELSWKPSASLDRGLAETARWFLQAQSMSS